MFSFSIVKVVRLVSTTFNYTSFDRTLANSKKRAADRFPDTIGRHVKLGLTPKVRLVIVVKAKAFLVCKYILYL
jgi:hypothetical protein